MLAQPRHHHRHENSGPPHLSICVQDRPRLPARASDCRLSELEGVRIEGKGVEPDVEVNWSFEDAVAGRDRQLDYALSVVQAL